MDSKREEQMYRNYKPLGKPITRIAPQVEDSFRYGVASPPGEDIKTIIYPSNQPRDTHKEESVSNIIKPSGKSGRIITHQFMIASQIQSNQV